jgi:hypothetical protein
MGFWPSSPFNSSPESKEDVKRSKTQDEKILRVVFGTVTNFIVCRN